MNTVTVASSTAGRIGTLIRLLGSDKGGEVVAAASAIKRTLRGAGLDMHAFADVTMRALTSAPARQEHEADLDADIDLDVPLTIRFCLRHADELTDRELVFIHDLDRLVRRLGARLELTPKQENWLLSIFEKLRGVR